MSNTSDLTNLARLSVQRALLGALSTNPCGACVALDPDRVTITWYVAADLTDGEREDLQATGTEVIADFPSSFRLERFVNVDDRHAALPAAGSWVVLQRGFRTTGNV